MNLPNGWLPAFAMLVLLGGLFLVLAGNRTRQHRGLASGPTISLDQITLSSRRYGLVGRPNRLLEQGGVVIPEEWKSGRVLRPWHCIQLGVYLLLVEEQWGVKPPYGFVVLGDGTRHQIVNTAELRADVLELVRQLTVARRHLAEAIPVKSMPEQCRPCGMRGHCHQAKV